MKDLTEAAYRDAIRQGELNIRVGPYVYRIQTNIPIITEGIRILYADFPTEKPGTFADYDIGMRYPNVVSRLRRRARFYFEYQKPFREVSHKQTYASMEWGLNWCVSVYPNEYLKLHAAVVAKNGMSIVMPGIPGAGKSTLCAALGLSGWRILSDEHALIPPGTAEVVPLCRPVSLKNESIEIIRSFDNSAVFGPVSTDTHKGVVAHMKADLTPDSHASESLPVHVMLFPRYSAEDKPQLARRLKTQSFILAAYHSFNYSLLGESGFKAMQALIDSVECYDLVYKDLDWAIAAVDGIHSRALKK